MRRFLLAATSAACVVGCAFAGDEKANAKSVPATRLVPETAGGGKSGAETGPFLNLVAARATRGLMQPLVKPRR